MRILDRYLLLGGLLAHSSWGFAPHGGHSDHGGHGSTGSAGARAAGRASLLPRHFFGLQRTPEQKAAIEQENAEAQVSST